MNKVTVSANKDGVVVVVSKNTDYAYIRLTQKKMIIDDVTGFAKTHNVSALMPGLAKDLIGLGWSEGDEVDGKIRIVEQLEPFNKKSPDNDYKVAGETGIVCSQNGNPIYKKHLFTFNESLEDKFEDHTNGEEIKEAFAALKNKKSEMPQSEDFSL